MFVVVEVGVVLMLDFVIFVVCVCGVVCSVMLLCK